MPLQLKPVLPSDNRSARIVTKRLFTGDTRSEAENIGNKMQELALAKHSATTTWHQCDTSKGQRYKNIVSVGLRPMTTLQGITWILANDNITRYHMDIGQCATRKQTDDSRTM